MFDTSFKIIEIYPSGLKVEHFLKGKRSDVRKDVEAIKANCRNWEMVGKKVMIVFA